jgi:hypothetical protein
MRTGEKFPFNIFLPMALGGSGGGGYLMFVWRVGGYGTHGMAFCA